MANDAMVKREDLFRCYLKVTQILLIGIIIYSHYLAGFPCGASSAPSLASGIVVSVSVDVSPPLVRALAIRSRNLSYRS